VPLTDGRAPAAIAPRVDRRTGPGGTRRATDAGVPPRTVPVWLISFVVVAIRASNAAKAFNARNGIVVR
jgi:hypothetical protein